MRKKKRNFLVTEGKVPGGWRSLQIINILIFNLCQIFMVVKSRRKKIVEYVENVGEEDDK
jgi:hypothetical protein